MNKKRNGKKLKRLRRKAIRKKRSELNANKRKIKNVIVKRKEVDSRTQDWNHLSKKMSIARTTTTALHAKGERKKK